MIAQDRIKADFDEIARLTDDSGTDRYEKLLLSLVPVDARRVLDSGAEARAMADRRLPGATLFNHWLWRYTIVWDKLERG